MDGVNNAFCLSKEEYEIARLATKCAGLQGKIDDQAAEIISLQETINAVTGIASDAEKLVISQRDEIAALTAKLEAAEQDAARYRFLKLGRSCDIELMELNEEDGEYYGVCLIKGDYIDNTIDADMTKMNDYHHISSAS